MSEEKDRGIEKVELLRFDVRRRRALAGFLERYADKSFQYLRFLDKSVHEYTDRQELVDRIRYLRSYDELKRFLIVNGTKLINSGHFIFQDVMQKYLDVCVEKYLDNETYSNMCKGEDIAPMYYNHVDTAGDEISFEFHFTSLKEAIRTDETIDFEGDNELKRHLYKTSVFNDQEFKERIGKLAGIENSNEMEQTSFLESIYEIIEKSVFPFYHYIDESDIRDIIQQLSMEKMSSRGYFDRGFTIVHCRTNIYRNFVVTKPED